MGVTSSRIGMYYFVCLPRWNSRDRDGAEVCEIFQRGKSEMHGRLDS